MGTGILSLPFSLSFSYREDEMSSCSTSPQPGARLLCPGLSPTGPFASPPFLSTSLRSCCYILEEHLRLSEKCPCLFGTPHMQPVLCSLGEQAGSAFHRLAPDVACPQGLSWFSWTNRRFRVYALLGKTLKTVKMQLFVSHCKRE